jgi:chromosome segregation ATPase
MATRKTSSNATRKVTTTAEASAVKLTKATTALSKVVEELMSTNDQYESLVQDIQLKQAEMESLETEFSEKEREMTADLKLRAKENEISLVNEVLQGQNKVAIDSTELANIRRELETTKANYASDLKSETAKAVAIISTRHEGELKQQELQFEAASATIKAELSTAKDKISAYEKQIEDYKAQITADREARVQEAQARGGQNIVVSPDSKR